MNPIDDFAALRPDVEPPTPDELDELWDRATTLGSSAERPAGGRRRLALLGAAASLVLGVAAVALVADRADAPAEVMDPVSDSAFDMSVSDSSEAPTPTTITTTIAGSSASVTVDPPPTWVVTDDGWIASAPEVLFDPGLAMITLVAGPDGVDESWVVVVDGVSDPLMSVGGLATQSPDMVSDDPSESDDAIIAWRTDPAIGNFIVSAGGVSKPDADAVFTAVRTGADLPAAFTVLPEISGSLAQRRVTQRFDHPDGRWIEIDTQSGGQPRYDVELQRATAFEFFDAPEGADVSNIAFLGEYTLLVRTGFWVSTIRTSASPESATSVADLVDLVSVAETPRRPVDVSPTIARLAIGDSVMLGAAEQLIDLGLTVDAVESRAFVNGLDFVRTLAEQDRLPETMVVHLGGNGTIDEVWMREFVDLVAEVDTVVLLTSAIDRDYIPGNNELIAATAAAQDNVQVLDWAELAASCPGDCFEVDGFHLTPDGRAYYAAVVSDALGTGEV